MMLPLQAAAPRRAVALILAGALVAASATVVEEGAGSCTQSDDRNSNDGEASLLQRAQLRAEKSIVLADQVPSMPCAVPAQGRCWFLSELGESCNSTCARNGRIFSFVVPVEGAEPIMPRLLDHTPVLDEPWTVLECYGPEQDNYHPANINGAKHYQGDAGKFKHASCKLACPCVDAVQQVASAPALPRRGGCMRLAAGSAAPSAGAFTADDTTLTITVVAGQSLTSAGVFCSSASSGAAEAAATAPATVVVPTPAPAMAPGCMRLVPGTAAPSTGTFTADSSSVAVSISAGQAAQASGTFCPGQSALVPTVPEAALGDCAVQVQGRCWFLSELGETCNSTCTRNGRSFSYAIADSTDPIMPRLLDHAPSTTAHAWAVLECYGPDRDIFHPANANGAKHLSTDAGQWRYDSCKLACPCGSSMQQARTTMRRGCRRVEAGSVVATAGTFSPDDGSLARGVFAGERVQTVGYFCQVGCNRVLAGTTMQQAGSLVADDGSVIASVQRGDVVQAMGTFCQDSCIRVDAGQVTQSAGTFTADDGSFSGRVPVGAKALSAGTFCQDAPAPTTLAPLATLPPAAPMTAAPIQPVTKLQPVTAVTQAPMVSASCAVSSQGRCWFLSEMGEACNTTCARNGRAFSFVAADNANPIMPRLLDHTPNLEEPFAIFECYGPDRDIYHPANVNGAKHYSGDASKWRFDTCKLACPCGELVQNMPAAAPTIANSPMPQVVPQAPSLVPHVDNGCVRAAVGAVTQAAGTIFMEDGTFVRSVLAGEQIVTAGAFFCQVGCVHVAAGATVLSASTFLSDDVGLATSIAAGSTTTAPGSVCQLGCMPLVVGSLFPSAGTFATDDGSFIGAVPSGAKTLASGKFCPDSARQTTTLPGSPTMGATAGCAVPSQGRCWFLSELGENCNTTCAKNGRNFSFVAADNKNPIMPRLLDHAPAVTEKPWAVLECYGPDRDIFHPANLNGAKHYVGDAGQWNFSTCKLSCPCGDALEAKRQDSEPVPTSNRCTWQPPDDCSKKFEYRGVEYEGCIMIDNPTPWCSLDRVHQGFWSTCTQVCDSDAQEAPAATTTTPPPRREATPMLPADTWPADSACARHPDTEQDDVGMAASLDEAGYQTVVAAESSVNMKRFICRVARKITCEVVDLSALLGFIPHYNGVTSQQTYAHLESELESLCHAGGKWITAKAQPPKTGSVAPTTVAKTVAPAEHR